MSDEEIRSLARAIREEEGIQVLRRLYEEHARLLEDPNPRGLTDQIDRVIEEATANGQRARVVRLLAEEGGTLRLVADATIGKATIGRGGT
jgi:hypothetical protein